MTTNNTILNKAKQVYLQSEEETAEKERQAWINKEREDQTALLEFQEIFVQAVSEEMRQELGIRYRIPDGRRAPYAYFLAVGLEWTISLREMSTANIPAWYIEGKKNQHSSNTVSLPAKNEQLEPFLLHQIGKQYVRLEQKKIDRLAQIERDAIDDQKQAEAKQKQEQERLQVLAVQDLEDSQNRALLAEKRKESLAQFFVWPQNCALTLWYMTCVVSVGQSSDGAIVTEDITGWMTANRVDEEGNVALQPYYRSHHSSAPQGQRVIHLDPRLKPTWEQHIFRCIEDLPESLYYDDILVLPNMQMENGEDDKQRLLWHHHYSYKERLGIQPIAWICDLVK